MEEWERCIAHIVPIKNLLATYTVDYFASIGTCFL